MPLPWKKTRTNRISRIVADLQPPSRVVETGFPTSLIDLFVKNRDRIMKRQSFKKRRTNHFHHDVSESLAPPPTPSLSPHNSLRLVDNSSGGGQILDHLEDESAAAPEVEVEFVGGGESNANGTVFVVAVKMFLVVLPALSTTKLALGITLSAFLLLLLEIFGKFAVGFFNPCWIPKRFLSESEITTAADRRQGELTNGDNDRLIHGEEEPNSATDEIQIVEPNSDNEHVGDGEAMQHEFLSRENRWGYLDEEVENEEQGKLRLPKNQRSRSAKLKAKIINKLIPKKLRSGKRMKSNNDNNRVKNKTKLCSETAQDNHEQENEHGSVSSCDQEDEDQERNGVWGALEEPAEMGMMGKGEEERKNLECIFVVVMILWGLLGGRFLALVLTVSGCFMFKFIKILGQKWKFE